MSCISVYMMHLYAQVNVHSGTPGNILAIEKCCTNENKTDYIDYPQKQMIHLSKKMRKGRSPSGLILVFEVSVLQ